MFGWLTEIKDTRQRIVHTAMRFAAVWVIAGLLAAVSLPAIAAQGNKNVLVLYSNSRLLPANVALDRGLRQATMASENRRLTLFDEFLDVPRFGGETYVRTIATYLGGKYASRPPDVIVVFGEEALDFILRNRAGLFPQAPVVHAAITKPFLDSVQPLPADVVGVPVEFDFSRTVDQALRWHPKARKLVIVTGSAPWDRQWEERLRAEAPRFRDRATVEFLSGLSISAVLKRLGELDGDAVAFTPGYFQDNEGHEFVPREAVTAMAAAANAPLYAPTTPSWAQASSAATWRV